MPKITIPRTSQRGQARNWAQLILDLSISRKCFTAGPFFKCGMTVDESALWPTPHYPVVPLLLEYAGTDRSGRGHNRSRDIHVLWRYSVNRREWDEIANVKTEGADWFAHLAGIVQRELVRPEIDHAGEARETTGRLCALMDGLLAPLTAEGKAHAISFLYDEISSRFSKYVVERAAVYDGAESLTAEVLVGALEIERFPPGRALTSTQGSENATDAPEGRETRNPAGAIPRGEGLLLRQRK